MRKKLDSWPPFPIVLTAGYCEDCRAGNILAILERHDRVCQIEIEEISSSLWEKALPLMQKPFPTLTDLHLQYNDLDYITPSVIPDSFLGGSAPRLRKLYLEKLPFLGLPKLLLSTTDLVHLKLDQIPDSGYISPDAIVTCLSTLTRLESFMLCFQSRFLPEWERRRTSSSTRTLLPSLTFFNFKGVSEYLEDIVDGIDTPLLDWLIICFFRQEIFDTPRLAQFVDRLPRLKTCNEARIDITGWYNSVEVLSNSETTIKASLSFECPFGQPHLRMSPLVQLCTSSFPQALIPMMEGLIITGSDFYGRPRQDGIDRNLWRELLRPFTAVKDLYLSSDIAPRLAFVLQDLVGESVMELFPGLQNILLKELPPRGFVPEGIEQFVAARQLAGHLVSISRCERELMFWY